MKILKNHDENGWITAIIEGRWVQAKVYDNPSSYGVDDGRVSKLSIGKTDTRDPSEPFLEQLDYHYDRGPDFSNINDELLYKILEELENLPKLFHEDDNTTGMKI